MWWYRRDQTSSVRDGDAAHARSTIRFLLKLLCTFIHDVLTCCSAYLRRWRISSAVHNARVSCMRTLVCCCSFIYALVFVFFTSTQNAPTEKESDVPTVTTDCRPTFWDSWDFFTAPDPTHGYITYVDQQTCEVCSAYKITLWKVAVHLVCSPLAVARMMMEETPVARTTTVARTTWAMTSPAVCADVPVFDTLLIPHRLMASSTLPRPKCSCPRTCARCRTISLGTRSG